jgi:hypothetical protein
MVSGSKIITRPGLRAEIFIGKVSPPLIASCALS